MQDVTITFTDGPLRGRSYDFEVGQLSIGRLPGSTGLELKGADTSVSRIHAELHERAGGIELRNVSPNGTMVDDKIVLDDIKIRPGVRVQIGSLHRFTVNWTSFERESRPKDTSKESDPQRSQGPLSSPIIQAVLGVYFLAMVAVFVWLMLSDDGGPTAGDDWPALAAAYDNYQAGEMPGDIRSTRAARAEDLVRKLRVMRTRKSNRDAEKICREMMSIDKDSKSPLYRYGARCLGSK